MRIEDVVIGNTYRYKVDNTYCFVRITKRVVSATAWCPFTGEVIDSGTSNLSVGLIGGMELKHLYSPEVPSLPGNFNEWERKFQQPAKE